MVDLNTIANQAIAHQQVGCIEGHIVHGNLVKCFLTDRGGYFLALDKDIRLDIAVINDQVKPLAQAIDSD